MRIAIVGTGPTGIYSFAQLIKLPQITAITLYEQGETLGVGMPYSPQTADSYMLANIASIEIPPLVETYLDWMAQLSPAVLQDYGLEPAALTERSFTPRLLLGAYYQDQLTKLIARARAAGKQIEAHAGCKIIDLCQDAQGITLRSDPPQRAECFDKVVLATGHVFEKDDDLTDHYFPNPWSGLLQVKIPAARIGIMGTSLSGIDAAMAVASQHGRFHQEGEAIHFETKAKGRLMIALMSWTGVLPEADFYCPLPYLPLTVMTPEALADAAKQPSVFAAFFDLFKAEIAADDPAWAQSIGLEDLDPEGFHDAYFNDREQQDPFIFARRNLAEVERNKRDKVTVAWRYAILRMHEQVEPLVVAFSEAERKRFDQTLKTVFVDNYAAVPSESIRRLLALREAGVIEILALGEDYDLSHGDNQTTIKTTPLAGGQSHVFDIFIDARGQQAMATKDLPFPSLRADILRAGQKEPQIGADYLLQGVPGYAGRLYMAALPFLMQDQPFVQGITACAEIGETIAKAEAQAAEADAPASKAVPKLRHRKSA